MIKRRDISKFTLLNRTQFKVRFSEIDSMHVVWHGDYVRYFEDGREAFGLEYSGLGYGDISKSGYLAPMVDLHLQYKRPLSLGEEGVIETR